jgi:hypothetical protein
MEGDERFQGFELLKRLILLICNVALLTGGFWVECTCEDAWYTMADMSTTTGGSVVAYIHHTMSYRSRTSQITGCQALSRVIRSRVLAHFSSVVMQHAIG